MGSITRYLTDSIAAALKTELPDGVKVELEIPRDSSHGDLASNIAFLLAKQLRKPPRTIAQEIAENFVLDENFISGVEVAGAGFLNFTFSRLYLLTELNTILAEHEKYGCHNFGAGKSINLEFVSANPTGPLNIVSARAAALGDCLKRILSACGYNAKSEFYVNDAGRQVLKLGKSLLARHAEQLGFNSIKVPEDGYHGSYLKEIAAEFKIPEEAGGAEYFSGEQDVSENSAPENSRYLQQVAGIYAVEKNLENQKKSLERYRVVFDYWVRESAIRASMRHIKVRDAFEAGGKIYQKDGALYFKSSDFGDEEDRVIWTSKNEPTYFLPDIAYHEDKFSRGFDVLIDIWGPDHHGYIPRMEAAMRAMGHPEDSFRVIIAQQVNLVRGGEKVKMSKRAGEMITMDDLLDEVGTDAARFFFLQRRPTAHLDFDLDLAVKETEENPVYYIQYAHARICSIERLADESGIDAEADLTQLKEEGELGLIRKLAEFPSIVEICGNILEPVRITVYLQELASSFHSFYQKFRIVTEDTELSGARLALCRGVKNVLRNGLDLIGVSAPERM